MKRFKFSLPVVIAILAISFTLPSSEAFKNELKPKRQYTCSSSHYDLITSINSGMSYDNTNNTGTPGLPTATDCFTFDHSPASSFTCNETQTYFCCAERGAPCTVNGIPGFKAIFHYKN